MAWSQLQASSGGKWRRSENEKWNAAWGLQLGAWDELWRHCGVTSSTLKLLRSAARCLYRRLFMAAERD